MKTILITGATGDLGRMLAQDLSTENQLILTARDQSKLSALHVSLDNENHHQPFAIDFDHGLFGQSLSEPGE